MLQKSRQYRPYNIFALKYAIKPDFYNLNISGLVSLQVKVNVMYSIVYQI